MNNNSNNETGRNAKVNNGSIASASNGGKVKIQCNKSSEDLSSNTSSRLDSLEERIAAMEGVKRHRNMSRAERLLEARKDLGLNGHQMACALKKSRKNYADMESGAAVFSWEDVQPVVDSLSKEKASHSDAVAWTEEKPDYEVDEYLLLKNTHARQSLTD
jgi:hypothetical protein